MLATVFGWYGAFGTSMLLSAYIFFRHGIVLSLLKYGWYAVVSITTVIFGAGYSFVFFALPWLIQHIGTLGAYGTGILLGVIALLLLQHVISYSAKRLLNEKK